MNDHPMKLDGRVLVKMVRDHVGDLVGPCEVVYEPIDERDVIDLARQRKVLEEALEFDREPSLSELADVYDAVLQVAELGGYGGIKAIRAESDRKAAERGGFLDGVGMYAVRVTA